MKKPSQVPGGEAAPPGGPEKRKKEIGAAASKDSLSDIPPTEIVASAATAPPGSSRGRRPDRESITEEIDMKPLKESEVLSVAPTEVADADLATDSIDPPTDVLPVRKPGDGSRDDTEEVFVIIPEEGAGGLPVVETVEVEDQGWDAGPTTTEVLKEMPLSAPQGAAGRAPGEPKGHVALEDVPLKKVNPMAEAEVPPPAAPDGSPGSALEEKAEKASDEEIKVIEEIAGLAADLDHEEPLGAGLDEAPERADLSDQDFSSIAEVRRGGGKLRLIAAVSALAAVVVLGVYFWGDLASYFQGGGEVAPVKTAAAAVATKSGTQTPVKDEKTVAREALRSKILLAVRVGLRAEKGKE